jgi:hypothetical protein
MKLLRMATLFCVLAVMSKVAVAVPMDYTFDVNFTSGPLSGVTETVFVTIDGVTGAGLEIFRPDSASKPILAFDFMFGGVAYSMTDDFGYPSFPQLRTDAGSLTSVYYDSSDATAFIGLLAGGVGSVVWEDSDLDVSIGAVLNDTWASATDTDVPTPATLALFGLGLISLAIHRRERVTHS